jgi:hypothetical protein
MKLISRLRIFLLALALVPMLGFATAPGSVSAQSSTRYLRLISIQCIETEDSTGGDEAYLRVAGNKVWGPKSINNGGAYDLTSIEPKLFVGQVEVSLFDEDSGFLDDDDWLGTATITSSEAGLGNRTVFFTQDGANYKLTYRVF